MRAYKYCYVIHDEFDVAVYKRYRDILLDTGGLTFEKELHDVDDTRSQIAHKDGAEIKLTCNADMDGVYIDTDVELEFIPALRSARKIYYTQAGELAAVGF